MCLNRLSAVVFAACSFVAAAQTPTLSIQEDFSLDPASRGWQVAGDTNLFAWDSTHQNLQVTWDSSQTNSYFCHPLGRVARDTDDFTLSFDLDLMDAVISGYGFQLGVGLFNLANATAPAFLRGTGANSPNLVEFDYFPDPEGILAWGPSVTSVMVDSLGIGPTNWSTGGFLGSPLALGEVFHIELNYTGSNQTLRTAIFQNGALFATVPDASVAPGFQGFAVDHLAIESYSGLNSGATLLGHGTIDNIAFTLAPPPVDQATGAFDAAGAWLAGFASRTNWLYTLERTTDLAHWASVGSATSGTGANLSLRDPSPPASKAFYRVTAARP